MSVHQRQAYCTIREGIRTFRYRPGQPLTAAATAKQLGMSTIPVREALMRLFAEGFIEHHDNRGFFVREITVDRLLDDGELIWLVLRCAVDKAVAGAGDLRHEPLVEKLAIAQPAQLTEAPDECLAAELEAFYEVCLDVVANERVAEVVRRVIDQTHYVRCVHFALRDRQEYLAERQQLVEAIRHSDRDGALVVLDQAHERYRSDIVALFKEVAYRAYRRSCYEPQVR